MSAPSRPPRGAGVCPDHSAPAADSASSPSGGVRPRRPEDRLVVALDVPALDEARSLVATLRPVVTWFKVGLELFAAAGPAALAMVKESGGRVFVDLKLHDIPHTVARAAAVLTRQGVDMISLHVAGGERMMAEAVASVREAAACAGQPVPILVGVTVLTSLGEADLAALGVGRAPADQVLVLAHLARQAGLDGWVASAREASLLRKELGPEPVIVTPGIRPLGSSAPGRGVVAVSVSEATALSSRDDQVRVATPAEAVANGADWLVVGRPVTRADDPVRAARAVVEEISAAVDGRRAATTPHR